MNSLLHIRNGGYWYVKSYFCAFFFFPDILSTRYDTDAGRADAVRSALTGHNQP